MKKLFLRFYKLNSLATTYLSIVFFLLLINFLFKTYQYSLGEIYKGEVIGIESFKVIKHPIGRFSSNKPYTTFVYPQKIKFTDKNNYTHIYSELSWDDEVKFEMNEKINILKTNNGKIYILTLFNFWLNTTNVILIFGASIFITILIEFICENVKA